MRHLAPVANPNVIFDISRHSKRDFQNRSPPTWDFQHNHPLCGDFWPKISVNSQICLCLVVGLASKSPGLLDLHLDLISLEPVSKVQLKALAEEMQAIIKGLEKVKQELTASENDGPISETFCKTLKEFIADSEAEVASVTNLYTVVGKNADTLALYFGEDPARYPFEQVTSTLLNFIRLFRKAHEENLKNEEMERKKAEKEAEMANTKDTNLTKKQQSR